MCIRDRTGAEYDLLAADGDVILFRQGGLYGAMDMDGNLLLTAAYTQLVSAGDGAFLALTTDPNDDTPDEILRIAGGEAVSTGIRTASGLEPLCDGLMPFPSNGSCAGASRKDIIRTLHTIHSNRN